MIINRLTEILSTHNKNLGNHKSDGESQYFVSYPGRSFAKRIFIFVMEPQSPEPVFVAKVSLDEVSDNYFENNFKNLTFLYERFKQYPLLSDMPQPEFYGKIGGNNVLIEKFLHGKKAELIFSHKRAEGLLDLFVKWLIDFNLITKDVCMFDSQIINREFESRFNLLFEKLGSPDKLKSFFSRTLDGVKKLSGKEISLLFCHGDYSVRNFIINNDRLRVLDWEYSRKSSLALLDMFHLCLMSVMQLENCKFGKCITKAFISGGEYNRIFNLLFKRYLSALEIEPVYLLPTFLAYLSDWVSYQSSITLEVKGMLEALADKRLNLEFV